MQEGAMSSQANRTVLMMRILLYTILREGGITLKFTAFQANQPVHAVKILLSVYRPLAGKDKAVHSGVNRL
jgi:hypothetical protein